jgi:S-adenosylhomocysteine hydrolase
MSAPPATKFKVADLSLAAFGRKEIELAEVSISKFAVDLG